MDPALAEWLRQDPDPDTRAELTALAAAGAHAELAARFAGRLQFGTAGLRAPMGGGPQRMNRLVVRQSSAGLAAYLLAQVPRARERGVLVGFDGRHNSRVFADDAARVLATAGLPVRLFERELPTPVVGFEVRRAGAAAGVVITASHNPPQYNGLKIYWESGAQIVAPHDAGIAAAIDAASAAEIPCRPLAELRAAGLVPAAGAAEEEAYLAAVLRQAAAPPPPPLGIAYTPLHGVGARLAEAVLGRAGFSSVHTVDSQRDPDGGFPTVRFPNPEEPGAMDAVLRLAAERGCALACANDPDADRLGVAVRLADGQYRQLTGDEIGVLLGHWLLAGAPPNAVMATTIVSSRLLARMAQAHGVDFFTTLTGFKWIANGALRRAGHGQTLRFAYEEALGFSVGDLVWDKDGISALLAVAQLAAACAAEGCGLMERLESIYRQYGLFLTGQRSLAGATADGIGGRLRRRTPALVAGRKVEGMVDLAAGNGALLLGSHEPALLPPSDVLIYQLHGDARAIVRPSGTEPKIKCYYEVHVPLAADETIAAAEARAHGELLQLMDDHQRELAIL